MSDYHAAVAWKVAAWSIAFALAVIVTIISASAQPLPKPRPASPAEIKHAADTFIWAIANERPKVLMSLMPDSMKTMPPPVMFNVLYKRHEPLKDIKYISYISVRKDRARYHIHTNKHMDWTFDVKAGKDNAGQWKIVHTAFRAHRGKVL